MTHRLYIVLMCCLLSSQVNMAQTLTTDPTLEQQLLASGMLSRPLPVDDSLSLETRQLQLKVLQSEELSASNPQEWEHQGFGRLSFPKNEVCLHVPVSTGQRATGSADDPDYATFGRASLSLKMHGRDLRTFHRLVFQVFPQCEGTVIMNLNATLENAKPTDVGAHLINLRPNQWNTVIFDLSALEREQVERITFYTDLKGRNQALGDTLSYTLRHLRLERLEDVESDRGWLPPAGQISYSMSGYLPGGQKTALVRSTGERTFQLTDESGQRTLFSGPVQNTSTSLGTFGLLDFSAFQSPGRYRLRLGDRTTEPFLLSDDAFLNAQWRLLNFIFCQRCGYAVEGIHGVCHQDLFCDHNGQQICYGGGWHDAGDLSQQTLQTADVAYALLEAYERQRDNHPQLAERLLQEALWGLRFVLRCRFGDGYHASSLGLLHWTDSQVGTYDDIHTVRKQNNAYDNFLYAAYEAYAARVLPPSALRDSLASAAAEDFRFAEEKFQRDGYDRFPHVMEHVYNTSPSLFQATRSWAATQLFQLTGEDSYAQTAVESIHYVLHSQAQGEQGGYFCRDTTLRVPVHFIHQSRDQLFAQSLIALCQSQPEHPSAEACRTAIAHYADYLKRLMPYTAPYGMISSGIWKTKEYEDAEGFYSLHLFAPSDAPQRFDSQLRQGVRLDEAHYLRRFPIWFGIFNGNETIILSTGKAAALCGHFLQDETLRQIGLEQLYWTVGKNPFCQLLIYGEGHRYPSMDSFSSGEITGEIPVGIRSWGDTDEPYWPTTNNACYKEVWLTSAGKFLSLLAEY